MSAPVFELKISRFVHVEFLTPVFSLNGLRNASVHYEIMNAAIKQGAAIKV